MKSYPYVPSMVQAITVLTVLKMMTKAQSTCGSGSMHGKIMYERLPNTQLQGFDDDIVRDSASPFTVLEKCQDLCLRDRASNNIIRTCTSFDFQPGSRIGTYNGGPEYEESTCYLTREQASPEGIGNLMLVPNSVHFTEVCITASRPERECPNRRYIFERHTRKKLNLATADLKEVSATNRSECEDICLNEFSFVCRSATFSSTTRTCTLSRFTRRTHPELLEDDPNSDYLENTCLNAEKRCDGLAVFIKERNKRLGGPFEVDVFNNITLEECHTMCVRAEKYFCRSVEYDEMTKLCTLSEEDSISQKDDLGISSSPTHDFYDFACLDSPRGFEYPDNKETLPSFSDKRPDTAFQRFRTSRLGGDHQSELSGRTLSECLDECLRQPSFQCRSAVYSERYRSCRLSRYNQHDGMRIIYDADYDYYENLKLGSESDRHPNKYPNTSGSGNRYPPSRYPPSSGGNEPQYPINRYPSGGGENVYYEREPPRRYPPMYRPSYPRDKYPYDRLPDRNSYPNSIGDYPDETIHSIRPPINRFPSPDNFYGHESEYPVRRRYPFYPNRNVYRPTYGDSRYDERIHESNDRYKNRYNYYDDNFKNPYGNSIVTRFRGDDYGHEKYPMEHIYIPKYRPNYRPSRPIAEIPTIDRRPIRPISPGPDGPIYDNYDPVKPYRLQCNEQENFKKVGPNQKVRKEFVLRSLTTPSIQECQDACAEVREFICRSFNFRKTAPSFGRDQENCELSDQDVRTLDPNNARYFENVGSFDIYERSFSRQTGDEECLDVSQVCNEDGMEFTLRTVEGFFGRIYTYGYYDRCYFRGNGGTVNVLRISEAQGYPECGTQRYGDTMTNIVVVQFSDYVQTGKDKRFNLTCLFRGPGEAVVSSEFIGAGSGSPIPIEYLPAENTLSSKVRLLILYQGRPTTTIAVGDPLTFRLVPQDGYNYLTDIFATNVVARDPYTGRSVQLIDRIGCPIDSYVFPELDRGRNGDSLEAHFNAFKIPESNFLVFEATVRTCRERCQPAYCQSSSGRSEPSFGRRKREINETKNDEANTEKNTTSYNQIPVTLKEDNILYTDVDNESDEHEYVREMIEVFESREKLHNEASKAELSSEIVCIAPGIYQCLISAVIILVTILITITVFVGIAYRRYWLVMQKNVSANRASSHISSINGTKSCGMSAFGTSYKRPFSSFTRSKNFPAFIDETHQHETIPCGQFEDPSEPIYTDPSLFERPRSLRSISISQKNANL